VWGGVGVMGTRRGKRIARNAQEARDRAKESKRKRKKERERQREREKDRVREENIGLNAGGINYKRRDLRVEEMKNIRHGF